MLKQIKYSQELETTNQQNLLKQIHNLCQFLSTTFSLQNIKQARGPSLYMGHSWAPAGLFVQILLNFK